METRIYPASDSELMNVTAFIEEELEKVECPMKLVIQFTVSLEEIFVNVAHYGYPDKEGTVEVTTNFEDDMFSITFVDSGIPFDPLAKEDPDITLSADERTIGGLGIFMVKKYMDVVAYEYKDGKNVFCMKKKIR